jgi:hypothetical protein
LRARGNCGETLGCVRLRPLDIPGACEVKRLYVREVARRNGAGWAVMNPAIALYRALGFAPIHPYWDNIATQRNISFCRIQLVSESSLARRLRNGALRACHTAMIDLPMR